MKQTARTQLVEARKRRQWTQQEVADLVGTTQHNVSRWERGQTVPGRYFRAKLCTLFGASAQALGLLGDPADAEQPPAIPQLSSPPTKQPLPLWQVPFPRNPFFTGRNHLLQDLHVTLHHERAAILCQSYALSGLGGIGKTQTALEYAYRYAHDYTAVFWINAETAESTVASFHALAKVLDLPEQDDRNQQRVVAAVLRWLTRHAQWLLIFDNLEALDVVKAYLPPARQGAMLFTTRQQALSISEHTLDLDKMTAEEGLQFLLHRARLLAPTAPLESLDPAEVAIARKIVTSMDGLPLALDQAGAYIEATRCTLSDYLALWQVAPLQLLDERDPTAEHPLSVTRTLRLAVEQAERSHPQAADVLTACAFLAPEAIPEAFFLEGATHLGPPFETLAADPLQFQAAMKTLLTYSLIQRQATPHTLTIHRLVQAVLKDRLSDAAQQSWAARLVQTMSALFPAEEMQGDYWSVCERLLPHALVCMSWIELREAEAAICAPFMSHVALYLANRARFAEAELLYRRAWRMAEQAFGPEHPLVAEVLHGLATLYADQGKLTEAEPLYARAVQLREAVLGPAHPLVAVSLNMLAETYRKQGRYSEAEPLYRRALTLRKQTGALENPQGAALLNNLALLYWQQERRKEAEPLYEEAWHIWERTLGPDHPQVAFALNNLAILYAEQGRYPEAEPLFQRALHIREHTLGPDHPQVAYPLNNLAELYVLQGNYEQAELLYQHALQIWERALGPGHPQTVHPLGGLADLYQAQGKDAEAQRLYERALAIRQEQLGAQHPEVADSLYALAHFHQRHHRPAEALSLYHQALMIRQGVFGPAHPKVTEILEQLAVLAQQAHQ